MKWVKVRKWREFNNEWAIWCSYCRPGFWPVHSLRDHRRALVLADRHARTHRKD